MLIDILIFFCTMVGASLRKFLIRGAGEKKVKKHWSKPMTAKGYVGLTLSSGKGGAGWLHGLESNLLQTTHSLQTLFDSRLNQTIQ